MAKIRNKLLGIDVEVPANHPYIVSNNPEWEVITLEDNLEGEPTPEPDPEAKAKKGK